jgi:hypothetical protein
MFNGIIRMLASVAAPTLPWGTVGVRTEANNMMQESMTMILNAHRTTPLSYSFLTAIRTSLCRRRTHSHCHRTCEELVDQ